MIALDTRVRRIVGDIRRQIVPNSFLSITGYTDTRGNAELNQKLSTERAATVAQLIGAESMEVAGKGISVLHNNALPEGRFYNRYVRVDMRLPIVNKRSEE
jgi:outer membrane protein OmpA-like peptidoglycan-associated protein